MTLNGRFKFLYAFVTLAIVKLCRGHAVLTEETTTAVPDYYDYDDYTTDIIRETTAVELARLDSGFPTQKFDFFTIEPARPEANADEEHSSSFNKKSDCSSISCSVKNSIRGWLYARLDNRFFMGEEEIEEIES